MGGFVFALFYPFIIITYALLLGALIASLAVFINNTRAGSKNGWPVKNKVGAIVAGLIFVAVIITTVIVIIYTSGLIGELTPASSSAPASSAAIALLTMNL